MTVYGAGEILLTSMDRDGTKQGFNLFADTGYFGSHQHSGHCQRRCWEAGAFCGGYSRSARLGSLGIIRVSFRDISDRAEAKAAMAEAGIPVRPK